MDATCQQNAKKWISGSVEELRRDCWMDEVRMRADKWPSSLTAKW
jgi:hypothetical protein